MQNLSDHFDNKLCCFLQNYNPKTSDFGLAKLGTSEGQSHVRTWVMDTYGYAAPEYIAKLIFI